MSELFRAGGPLMWIILLCSLIALTIIFERILTLRKSRVAPSNLRQQIFELVSRNKITQEKIDVVHNHSPLGVVFAAGLTNISHGPDDMKEAI